MRPTMGLSGLLLFLVTVPMFWVETEGCVCTLWGEPHVVQFDGNYFHHTGICEYVVARDECSANGTWTFLVTAKMIEVNSPIVSMVYSVRIETADAVIDMSWGYGNIGVSGSGFSTQYIGPNVVIEFSTLNLIVKWDFKQTLVVEVGTQYLNNTCGLCGFYNGDPTDDFEKGPACTVPGSPPPPPLLNGLTTNKFEFGNSWWVDETTPPPHICCEFGIDIVERAMQDANAVQTCTDIFVVFDQCFPDTGIRDFYFEACVVDMFFGNDDAIWRGITVRSTNLYCCACGHYVLDWNPFNNDKPDCGPNGYYVACGPPEQNTCQYLLTGVSPPATPVAPGCVCDAGYYLKDDSCVLPAECGCVYQGVYYEEGAILLDNPCISYLVCTSNSMVRHLLNCDQDPKATCPVVGGKVICVCPFGTFDLHGDGSECVYCEFFGPRWTHLDLAISPNCYYFSKRERDFESAREYCENHHGMLVKIENHQENQMIWMQIRGKKNTNSWIGMKIDHSVSPRLEYWIDQPGVQAMYTNFANGEPNNHNGNEDCVQIYRKNGKWNDQRCSKVIKWICEIQMFPPFWIGIQLQLPPP
ncbi:hypothetical protein ScPMuIL_014521 [Solemya velum]